MAAPNENVSMALFCDFENVALGVRDAKYEKFDIKPILERLLLKGSIVVKKAYCDWDRYKTFKATMHEANFELIEIPHVRQSGKNSADIRLVVDALDLCYTKSHVNTFVIISGDSDFSPLVSKLRENAKQVIGVGVKQSTSDLLIANCDEFIFYDDLIREIRHTETRREGREAQASNKRAPEEIHRNKEDLEQRKLQAINMAVETFDALVSERGDSGKIWASMLKNAIKRRRPDFNETYYGFRTFGALLEEAQIRGQLQFSRDDKSGTYVYRSNIPAASGDAEVAASAVANSVTSPTEKLDAKPDGKPDSQADNKLDNKLDNKPEPRQNNRSNRTPTGRKTPANRAGVRNAPVVERIEPSNVATKPIAENNVLLQAALPAQATQTTSPAAADVVLLPEVAPQTAPEAMPTAPPASASDATPKLMPELMPELTPESTPEATEIVAPVKKRPPRARRPRKTDAST